ncbi:MAG: CDP-alcohol phosphatidyltransferase family protein [Clostridiales bacterium]|nr:CDP-alcohol phosphatidyltransferase family protein [Clostridiales bacterium]
MKELFKGCWTVPNLLSVIRIILIPVFAVLFYNDNYIWAVVVLFISGLSDFFDGKIARRFNQFSALGKILDPIADKLTQIVIAVMLFLEFRKASSSALNAFSWVFLYFLFKELVMLVGGALLLKKGLRPSAAIIYGKIATFAFYAVMIMIMAFGPEVGAFRNIYTMGEALLMVLVVVAAILTTVALLSYAPASIKQYKEGIVYMTPDGKTDAPDDTNTDKKQKTKKQEK